MWDDVRVLVQRHLPGLEIVSVARLGEGEDNVVYQVNEDLIVRASKEPMHERRRGLIRREADLLATVAGLATLPVPEIVFADPEAGVLSYIKLPGVPLNDHPEPPSSSLAPALGGFIGSLHRAPLGEVDWLVPHDTPPMARWRTEAERDYVAVVNLIPAPERRLVEAFLGRALPPEPRSAAFCHNDLGSEHILVEAGSDTISGVIDWADAAIADPVVDLALILRDLGPGVLALTLQSYGGRFDDVDWERAVFYARCSLLEDIAYGVRTGTDRYLEAGLAHLGRTFGAG